LGDAAESFGVEIEKVAMVAMEWWKVVVVVGEPLVDFVAVVVVVASC
jgi:type IV secretory pathway VirB3-like protein